MRGAVRACCNGSFLFVCLCLYYMCERREKERKKEQSEVKVKICIITSNVSLYIWLAPSLIHLSLDPS